MTQSQATTTHTVLCSDTVHHTHSSNSSSTVLPASLSAVNLRKWTLVGLTEASISAVGLRAVAGAHCLSPGYPSSRPWWLPWRRDPTLIPGGSELPLSICDRKSISQFPQDSSSPCCITAALSPPATQGQFPCQGGNSSPELRPVMLSCTTVRILLLVFVNLSWDIYLAKYEFQVRE